MPEQRKASDILLSLEEEVRKMKEVVGIQDLILKTLLNSSNKTNSLLNDFILSQSKKETPKTQENDESIPIQGGVPIEVETEFKGQRRIQNTKASNADIEFKDYLAQRKSANIEQSAQPQVKSINNQEKKLPVTQRVQDNNGKDVFMGVVEITSNNGEIISKIKTNAQGKWQSQLCPGKYMVNVSKTDASTKKKFESKQEVIIPNSNNAVILSTFILNKE